MKSWSRNGDSPGRALRENWGPALGPALVIGLILAQRIFSNPARAETPGDQPSAASPSATPAGTEAPAPESGLKSLIRSIAPGFFDDDGAQAADPTTMESDAGDLVNPEELLSDAEMKLASPWQVTDFGAQKGALGWSETAFEIPKGLESRVAFWRDIYTKYTATQGVMHDRDDVTLIYEQIDFGSIMDDKTKNVFQKARAREKLVKERRKEIVARLNRLQNAKSEDGLAGEDLRYWKMFASIQDKDKFKEAAGRGRVRFQLGQRDRFIVGVYHSGRYLRQMEKIFREEGLPIELTRLPFVESSFNIHARSRVGASGVWQFMRRTARSYLKTSSDVDERNDPLRATRASARLLRSNYALLQSWPLAVTGYNHGPNGVRRIVEKMRTRDLGEIVNTYSSRRFGFASENFYSCFLAALDVERNAKKYFGDAKWGPEMTAVEVKLKRPLSYKVVLDFFDGDVAAAELANPHLLSRVRKGRAPVPKGTFIRVPSARAKIAEDLQEMPGGKIGKFLSEGLTAALKELPLAPISPPALAIPKILPEPAASESPVH